jgi:VanZ family protein
MRRLTVLFFIFLVAIIIGADTGHLPFLIKVVYYDMPYGDKIGHFVLMGILGFLVNASALISFPQRKPGQVVLWATLALMGLIALEEASQLLFPRRTFSLIDLACGYMGVGISVWSALLWGRSRRKQINSSSPE